MVGDELTVRVSSAAARPTAAVQTIVGDYTVAGVNHGRKVYHKTLRLDCGENIDVLLYYWDDRDGTMFNGWWFGNKLGGTQVWSGNAQTTESPPHKGWKIPWDGEVDNDVLVHFVNGQGVRCDQLGRPTRPRGAKGKCSSRGAKRPREW